MLCRFTFAYKIRNRPTPPELASERCRTLLAFGWREAATMNTFRQGLRLPQPTDNEAFMRLILRLNPACSCRQHSTHVYARCARSVLHEHVRRLSSCCSFEGTGLFPASPGIKKYEAIALARIVKQNMSTLEKDMNDDQKLALNDIKSSTFPRLSRQNAGLYTSEKDMARLLNRFNLLFFFGALNVRFEWNYSFGPRLLGQCSPDGLIQMNPVSYTASGNDMRTLRIGTLLHEAIHALFFQHACHHCPTFSQNVDAASGHGRAFMIVATAVEQACKRLFNEDISVTGAEDWLSNWGNLDQLPSVHDMIEWRWIAKEVERRNKANGELSHGEAAEVENGSENPELEDVQHPASAPISVVVCAARQAPEEI